MILTMFRPARNLRDYQVRMPVLRYRYRETDGRVFRVLWRADAEGEMTHVALAPDRTIEWS